MKFTLTVDIDHAAFVAYPEIELSRILMIFAQSLTDDGVDLFGMYDKPIFDAHDNIVGHAGCTEI